MTTRRLLRAGVNATVILALGAIALACSATDRSEPEAGEGAADEALWARGGARWSPDNDGHTRISVCWETGGSPAEKDRVRAAVASSWSAAAPIDFTGWADCGTAGADLRVRVADERPHVAKGRFGRHLQGVAGGLTLNFSFLNFNLNCSNGTYALETCIDGYAMHEFGHVLGFLHEQDRPDAPATCPNGRSQWTDTDPANGLYLNAYDPASVMNYCASNALFTHPALSGGDIAGVRKWYAGNGNGNGNVAPAATCWYPCSAQGYAPGECRMSGSNAWSCQDGCVKLVVSCANAVCRYPCARHGYADGECRVANAKSWLCENGCISQVDGCP